MTEKHKLISRIVDREDRPKDWTSLEDVAKHDRSAWRDLLFALRDDAAVREAVEARLAVADRIAAPVTSTTRGRGWSTATMMTVAGWVAAAVLALLWLDGALAGDSSPAAAPGSTAEAGTMAEFVDAPDATPENVVGELPRLMVQARPVAGREEVEVIYVRRTLERVLVKKAYQLKVDESGQPFTVPADLTAYMPPRTY